MSPPPPADGDELDSRPSVAVVGAGILGARLTRELLTPGADAARTASAVSISTRRQDRRDQLSSVFGSSAEVRHQDGPVDGSGTDGPADVVVVARGPREQLDVVRDALAAGSHVIATTDDPDEVESILRLHADAVAAERSIIVGAVMSPGLTCLLARHAGNALDTVEEIHVARDGAAGPACARQRLRALRGAAQEWRDGTWVRRSGFSGRELCWFPDPIGARDCYRAGLAEPLVLLDAFPDVERVSARLAASPLDRILAPLPVLVGPPDEGGPGGARVEVRGTVDGRKEILVYGVFDRAAVAAAATAAVLALHVASGAVRPGSHGAAAIDEPVPILRELARRGVRAATFDGV